MTEARTTLTPNTELRCRQTARRGAEIKGCSLQTGCKCKTEMWGSRSCLRRRHLPSTRTSDTMERGGGGGEQETRSPREERLKNSHITVITKPKGMWGRVFSKGDTGSDPHSRKFTSGQPGMDWEARWLRGQLRGHCFAILTIVTLGSGCAWNCPSYSTNWFAEPASLSWALHYAEAGAPGKFSSQHPLAHHVAVSFTKELPRLSFLAQAGLQY